jgi:hypothetical protein
MYFFVFVLPASLSSRPQLAQCMLRGKKLIFPPRGKLKGGFIYKKSK